MATVEINSDSNKLKNLKWCGVVCWGRVTINKSYNPDTNVVYIWRESSSSFYNFFLFLVNWDINALLLSSIFPIFQTDRQTRLSFKPQFCNFESNSLFPCLTMGKSSARLWPNLGRSKSGFLGSGPFKQNNMSRSPTGLFLVEITPDSHFKGLLFKN